MVRGVMTWRMTALEVITHLELVLCCFLLLSEVVLEVPQDGVRWGFNVLVEGLVVGGGGGSTSAVHAGFYF